MGRQSWIPEEHHDVWQVAVILAEFPNLQPQMHPKGITAQREEETLAEAEQTRVTPEHVNADGKHRIREVFAIKIDAKIADMQRVSRRQECVQKRHEDDDHKGHDPGEYQFAG